MRASRLAATAAILLSTCLAMAGCGRNGDSGGKPASTDDAGAGRVTVEGDDRIADSLTWDRPQAMVPEDGVDAALERAQAALEEGRLYEDAGSAIPLYLAILAREPGERAATAGLRKAQAALLQRGKAALADAGDDVDAMRRLHEAASVLRAIAPADKAVQDYLRQVDRADRLWELNRQAEADLREGRLGEAGGGALESFRKALQAAPGNARALQGLAAVESALIRRAEAAARESDFTAAAHWLEAADAVHPGEQERGTIADARARIERVRADRLDRQRDEGVRALQQRGDDRDIALARSKLAELLRIAEPGNPAGAELRRRIDLATHYGLFRPGQAFTDALGSGARGPEMVVVPHGAYAMGAADGERGSSDSERPRHYIRFERGFAMSRTEVTVAEFGRFVAATGYRPTASRRGFSMVYDERSGNFVRRSGVDWRNAYDGGVAAQNMPVVHVSARDADAYAQWLADSSGHRYHVPSEAQFEYVLRAGGQGRFPWGDGAPPADVGNITGSGDRSPSGRRWNNAFSGYEDGLWGPAPVASFSPNPYGLHDLAGNVSEWVADCWHDGYRRAPVDGQAWVNPGCRMRVMRGGAWASAPDQTRSAWRAPARVDTTNARLGFRVAREL